MSAKQTSKPGSKPSTPPSGSPKSSTSSSPSSGSTPTSIKSKRKDKDVRGSGSDEELNAAWAREQFNQLTVQLKEEEEAEARASVKSTVVPETVPLELAPEDIVLGDLIGEGVYSEVYKGYIHGSQVAVKKFKNQGLDPELLAQVRKEVGIMKSIRHPNLLLFLGACTKPGHLMIATELMDRSFHDLTKSKTPLLQKIVMSKEAARGLSWLHSLSPAIVHRDLKPENLLISDDEKVVKVCDFGLSLVKDHSKQEMEEMKKIRGSPAFMSPEALLGNDLTDRTDVYSFGMILWELLGNDSPYDALHIESFEQLIDEICIKGTREKIPDDCPSSLRKLISACWHPKPEQRPSMLQVLAMLDDCILEIAIPDADARKMWREHFSETNGLRLEISWADFHATLSHIMKLNPNEKVFKGLKTMLVKDEEESKNTVYIGDFGNILNWFGPMNATPQNAETFLHRMLGLFTKRWFHGDISLQTAQTRLAGMEPGTFLVRFSSNPGHYALSKVIEKDKERTIVHIRISHRPGLPYSFNLDQKQYEFASLDELVRCKDLDLGKACPGSRYYAQFRIKQAVTGYINTVTP